MSFVDLYGGTPFRSMLGTLPDPMANLWGPLIAMSQQPRSGGSGGTGSGGNVTPVTPAMDPKIQADILYDKPIALSALGLARIGGSIIFGPYFDSGAVTFGVSFGLPADPNGTRVIYDIALDSMVAWSSTGGGDAPGDGTFTAESFVFRFYPGRLDQAVDPLETRFFPGEAIAYRPQMVLFIENLPYARFIKPVPYVSCLIGDTTDSANPYDGINLGDALERVAWSPWAGYTSASFEAVNVTDVVPALLFKDNFNIVELCSSVTRAYRNLDVLQSDKLRIKDRGANVAPSLTVTRDNIVSGDTPVMISRAAPSEQPRELEIATPDPDQDYTIVTSLSKRARNPVLVSAAVGKTTMTLPLVLDASTRQSLATFAQFYEENARKRITFKVLAYGYELEPGDLVALIGLADGIDEEVWKITETLHGANYVVEITAEAILRCELGIPPPSEAWLTHLESGSFTAVQTFAGMGLGEEAADRLIVVAGGGTTNHRTITSVTIDSGGGPVAMTIDGQSMEVGIGSGGGFQCVTMFIASKVVPTGTTATVVVTYDGLLDGSYVDLFRVVGLSNPSTPLDVLSATAYDTGNPSGTIDTNGGVLIGAFGATDVGYIGDLANFSATTWSGIGTIHSNEPCAASGTAFWGSAASQFVLTSETSRTVSASNNVLGRKSIIVGSWE